MKTINGERKSNKKRSYRRERAHLTRLYRTVQKAFRYVEPFGRWSRVCQTDRGRDGRIDRLKLYSAEIKAHIDQIQSVDSDWLSDTKRPNPN